LKPRRRPRIIEGMRHVHGSPHDGLTESALLVHLADELRALADRAAQAGGSLPVHGTLTACDGRCTVSRRYRAELRAVIAVLEQTRTSFKSKELAALRRRLEDFLEATAMAAGAMEPRS
jgi:hypothetical protein